MPDTVLAINGGPPVFPNGPPAWPVEDEDVLDSLKSAYQDGSWGRYHGPHAERLCELLRERLGIEFVKLCCSGTMAVELALRGLRIGAGDEVILAGYDFSGNFRCVESVSARPVLADIDLSTASLDPAQLDQACSGRTKAIIVSHLHSGLASMPEIVRWAKQHAVAVVEDACQAPGAMVAGRKAGTWGDVGVFSFGGSKLLTAGRGGALITARAEVFQRVKIFAEQGNDAYPLSELQAAVLTPQIEKLDDRNQRRRVRVASLLDATRDLTALTPVNRYGEENRPSYYKLAWLWDGHSADGCSREAFIAAVQAEGVALDAGFRGFTKRGPRRCRRLGDLRNSQHAADSLVLLHHPVLLQPAETIDQVAAAIRKVISKLTASRDEENP